MSDEERHNPWTTLSTRVVYDNLWIQVREDQVLRPDGQPGIYGVVHFRNKAVGVLPVDDEGRIWLVGQYRYPVGGYSWEIPEGGGNEDEPIEDTALRELREETGFKAGRLELISTTHLSNSVSDEIAYVFRATDLIPGESEPEGSERLQVKRVEWSEAWQMLQRGQITDSMSVIALLNEAVRRATHPNGHQF
ncbi:NUDIX domain-containing protein [Singulisphaera sp. PoT]|uniref:NUDIX domain-containing protein n=1 Tax=Singulisphaera sp. PoT TaxID=3411797 RepID=UPI003BF5CBF9